MSKQLQSLSENTTFSHLKVTIQLKQSLSLSSFKGKTFHGALGWALTKKHPDIYNALCNLSQLIGAECPNPYFFIPPISKKTYFEKEQCLNFELKLFDKANEFLPEVIDSLFLLQEMGLGSQRTPFTIIKIEAVYQSHWLTVYHRDNNNLALPALQPLESFIAHPLSAYEGSLEYFIHTHTPLELIKHKKRLLNAPDLATFLFFIANRFAALFYATTAEKIPVHSWVNEINAAPTMLTKSRSASVLATSSNNNKVNIQGFEGKWCYTYSQELLPWLRLGELLHIGKKAGYGLGAYKLNLGVSSN